MYSPKVTVICLCHNQGRFVREAISSVMGQSYPDVQLLVVDDASSDNSVSVICECLRDFPQAVFFPLTTNVGNCKAFNTVLSYAAGEFIIDLAADDILLPERIAEGVKAFQTAGADCGVNFTDAFWVNEEGEFMRIHSDRFPHEQVPQGNIYEHLISRFFICSPTMMFRASVIRHLGGYDEDLAYEDFDFWIRSSREFKYCYTPKALVKKRVVRNSMSEKQFSIFDRQRTSTYKVCEKIMRLNRTAGEQRALSKRILYEMRVSARLFQFSLLMRYARLYVRNNRLAYSE